MGTVERFCMELFRIGTDRPPVSRCLGTVLCRAVLINLFTHEQFQSTATLSIHQEQEKFLKKCPTIHLFFEALSKIFFTSKFFSCRQLWSVELPFASFLSVPDENGSGSLHDNF